MTANTPALVQVPAIVGAAQASIDNNQLTTTAGNVMRQVVTPGDPANASNYQSFDAYGNAQVKFGPALVSQLSQVAINFSSSGQNSIVAAQSGKVIRIYRIWSTVAEQTNIEFQDGSVALSGPAPCNQGGGITLDYTGDPWYVGTAGNVFNLNSSNAVQVGGTVYYVQS